MRTVYRLCLLACFFSLLSAVSFASEGPIEFLNRKASQILSGDDCSQSSSQIQTKTECPLSQSKKSPAALEQLSETIYYNELAELELGRLECAVKKAKSLSDQEEVSRKSLERVNETLPYLDAIRQEIQDLISKNQLLRGQIGSFENTNQALKLSPEKQRNIKLYNDRNETIKKKMIEYERRMAEIPGSEIPEVRSMIEDRMSGTFSKLKLFSKDDYKRLGETALKRLQDSISVIKGSKRKGSNYSLDRDLKVRLAQDEELAAQLMARHPESAEEIHRFQCRAEHRGKGGDVLTIGSLAIPISGWGLAKLARMRSILAVPVLSKTAAQGSKVLGFSAMAVGSGMGFQELIDKCVRPDAGFTNNKCEVTLQSLAAEHSQFDCLSSLVLNSAAGAGGILALSKGQEARAVADFIAKNKTSTRARDLDMAASLNDKQRIDATEALFGRNLNEQQRTALIEAHNVGRGFGSYTADDIAKKREILRQGGFSRFETESLMWKGIAGQESNDFKKSFESIMRMPDSANRDFNLALLRVRTFGADDEQARGLFRSMTDKYLTTTAKKPPGLISSRDYSDIRSAASYWAATTKDPAEKDQARSVLISAFKKELDQIGMEARRRGQSFNRDEYTRDLIEFIRKGPGKSVSAEASKFEIEVLESLLANPKAWDQSPLPASLAAPKTVSAPIQAPQKTETLNTSPKPIVESAPSARASMPAPQLRRNPYESDIEFKKKTETAASLQSWLGRPFQDEKVATEMAWRPEAFAKSLQDYRTHDNLESAGFSTYEITMMRLSNGKVESKTAPLMDFESSRYFAELRKMEPRNPFLSEKSFGSEKEALETLAQHASSQGITKALSDNGRRSEYVVERIQSLIETQRKLHWDVRDAKTPDEAHKAMARFKMKGIECRNLYNAAAKLGINVIGQNPQWGIQKNFDRYCKEYPLEKGQ